MNISDIPAWFTKRFAADATGTFVRTVPETSVDPNAASLSLGFPPNTFTAIGAGGSPQDGRDVNGILNQLSAWAQWGGVGGPTPWSSPISAAAGGYPLGAIVLSNTTTGRIYQSQTNNNVTNPDTGGAGWAILVDKAATPADMVAGTSNERVVTPLQLATAGYDRVIAQSLIANGGFRVFASGFKECWGTANFAGNTSTTISYPITFTSFSNANCQAASLLANAQDNNPAVYSCGLTTFNVWNAVDNSLAGFWQAKGV